MPRRGHRLRCSIPTVSVASSFSAAALLLLLFIAFLSLFTPPLVDQRHQQQQQQQRSLLEDIGQSDSEIVFQVPKDGGSSRFGLWSSKLAKNFFGCSNASKKFAAEVNTRPDRYLAIATTGGLNQQRTGRSNPEKERRHGKCPLTSEEVGLMLRALGYGSDVHIYVASGEVYGGEDTLAPLKSLFPNLYSKETLASKEELEPSPHFPLACLLLISFYDGSDAFVTNNNGTMARILAGRRRYFGHKRTIRPNAKGLYSLFLNHGNLTWEAFPSKVRTYQRGFMVEPNEVRPGRGEFHEPLNLYM